MQHNLMICAQAVEANTAVDKMRKTKHGFLLSDDADALTACGKGPKDRSPHARRLSGFSALPSRDREEAGFATGC